MKYVLSLPFLSSVFWSVTYFLPLSKTLCSQINYSNLPLSDFLAQKQTKERKLPHASHWNWACYVKVKTPNKFQGIIPRQGKVEYRWLTRNLFSIFNHCLCNQGRSIQVRIIYSHNSNTCKRRLTNCFQGTAVHPKSVFTWIRALFLALRPKEHAHRP